jgi:hypothetical protein
LWLIKTPAVLRHALPATRNSASGSKTTPWSVCLCCVQAILVVLRRGGGVRKHVRTYTHMYTRASSRRTHAWLMCYVTYISESAGACSIAHALPVGSLSSARGGAAAAAQ